jgi:hypothetical protein
VQQDDIVKELEKLKEMRTYIDKYESIINEEYIKKILIISDKLKD